MREHCSCNPLEPCQWVQLTLLCKAVVSCSQWLCLSLLVNAEMISLTAVHLVFCCLPVVESFPSI